MLTCLRFSLVAKWKKQGYEKLCQSLTSLSRSDLSFATLLTLLDSHTFSGCLRCIQTKDMNYQGSTCICRVPKSKLKEGQTIQCGAWLSFPVSPPSVLGT